MGQAYVICNLDKRETLSTDWFGQGNHLPSLARPGDGVMVRLAILLAASGTDLYVGGPLYGRWAGDRIALVGDAYSGKLGDDDFSEDLQGDMYDQENGWIDISAHVRALLEREWAMAFPPPRLDGTERRSVLNEDGTLTLLPRSGETSASAE